MSEPDDDYEEPGFRHPLPQDDRLWRHPSELDDHTATGAPRRSLWSRLRRPAV